MGFINIAAKALGSALGGTINSAAKYARAGERANAVSAAAQQNAASFNQNSANIANDINAQTLASQYQFNSAGWEQAANWNQQQFERAMEFNAEQARLNREWQERMDNTKYQRAIKDMKTAGLNPVLAVTGNGISVGSGGGGAAASISGPSMGAPSGGLLGANDASISGYTGQMEYYAGLLGLLGNAMNGLSSAFGAFGNMPAEMIKAFADLMNRTDQKGNSDKYEPNWRESTNPNSYEYGYKERWEGYWGRSKGSNTR